MGKVTTTIEAQTEHIKETETMTEAVMKRILESIEGMQVIADSVEYLDGARKEIVETVSELSEIAKQNAATTQEVCTAANTVTENFDIVSGSMEGLKNIADELQIKSKREQYVKEDITIHRNVCSSALSVLGTADTHVPDTKRTDQKESAKK